MGVHNPVGLSLCFRTIDFFRCETEPKRPVRVGTTWPILMCIFISKHYFLESSFCEAGIITSIFKGETKARAATDIHLGQNNEGWV